MPLLKSARARTAVIELSLRSRAAREADQRPPTHAGRAQESYRGAVQGRRGVVGQDLSRNAISKPYVHNPQQGLASQRLRNFGSGVSPLRSSPNPSPWPSRPLFRSCHLASSPSSSCATSSDCTQRGGRHAGLDRRIGQQRRPVRPHTHRRPVLRDHTRFDNHVLPWFGLPRSLQTTRPISSKINKRKIPMIDD
jgi:hypothetical protein